MCSECKGKGSFPWQQLQTSDGKVGRLEDVVATLTVAQQEAAEVCHLVVLAQVLQKILQCRVQWRFHEEMG